MPSRRVISEEEIEDGLNVVARLIDRYGDVYWPVFERLERELEDRRSRSWRVKSCLKRIQRHSSP
ncbi:hypothetical protein [Hyphococcus sp.]|jgi:transposase-like protein|uniref:hypothetical protein n=1 Tax=Hyphococcus sp. TaxID=2038636 RepID=UPI0035C74090